MQLIKIVHRLRAAKGINEKLEILKIESDNQQWLKFLKYAYDPYTSYGVSPPKVPDFSICDIDNAMFEVLDQLASRDLTGNAAKEAASQLSTKYGEIPRLI